MAYPPFIPSPPSWHRPHPPATCHRHRRGSALIGTMIFAMIIGTVAGLYLNTASAEFRHSMRSLLLQKAVNVAESGAEEAIHAINTNDFSGWESLAPNLHFRQFNLPNAGGDTAVAFVTVDLRDPSAPKLYVEGRISNSSGSVGKQIQVELGNRSLFANGMTARNTIRFNGNRTYVDSYNSSLGPYHATSNRNDRGSVASISTAVNSVDINHADIWGFVSTGGAPPRVGNNGSILGADSPPGIKVDPNRVANDFHADLEPASTPPKTFPDLFINLRTTLGSDGADTKITAFGWDPSNNVTVRGNVTLIVTGNIDIKRDVSIAPGASLTIYAEGSDITVGGNGILNSDQIPSQVLIFGVPTGGSQTIKLHGNGALHGAVYAPNSNLELKGGGHSGAFYGAVVAQHIVSVGTYSFHYDEALGSFGGEGGFRLNSWRELITAAERMPMQNASAMGKLLTET